MACVISDQAERDLEDIIRYIEQYNPARACSFVDEIIDACHRRADFPRLGRRIETSDGEVYMFPFRNYVIIHQVLEDDTMIVVRVVHSARDFTRFL